MQNHGVKQHSFISTVSLVRQDSNEAAEFLPNYLVLTDHLTIWLTSSAAHKITVSTLPHTGC